MNVSYYGRDYDPSTFKGWRGFVIRLLARMTARLSRWNEKLVMKYLMHEQQFPRGARKALTKAFNHETTERRAIEALRELTDSDLTTRASRVDNKRERKNSPEGVTRTDRTQNMFAAYGDSSRGSRYVHKRNRRFADPAGDVLEFSAPDE